MRPAVLIVFDRPWMGCYRVGQVVEWDHPGSADLLFKRGVARPVPAAAGDAPAAVPPEKPKAGRKAKGA